MDKTSKLENNKWVQKLGFWVDHYINPATKIMMGYVVGLVLVVLISPNTTIPPFGNIETETKLPVFIASLLAVFIFLLIGYILVGLGSVMFGGEYTTNVSTIDIDPIPLLQHQIEKCKEIGSNTSALKFEHNVTVLFQMLPSNVRLEVEKRVGEYKIQTETVYYEVFYNVIIQEIMKGKFTKQENTN